VVLGARWPSDRRSLVPGASKRLPTFRKTPGWGHVNPRSHLGKPRPGCQGEGPRIGAFESSRCP
jgi:hypothetical protein